MSVGVCVCVTSTVQEEPVLASVRKPTMPAISELLDSTFSILDEENHHRLLTVNIYVSVSEKRYMAAAELFTQWRI